MQNLVIIGASGFIGSNLLKKLNNTDIKIIAVSLNLFDFPIFLESNNIIYEDYKTFANREESLNDYIVVNLAYTRSVTLEDIEASKDFTYKVSRIIERLNIKKYIYISTQSVYNIQRLDPASEIDEVLPASVYGEGKVELENWLKEFVKTNNISLSILRLASVVGEGMEKRITTRFVNSAFTTNRITIIDSGQIFSFIHIKDLIDVLIEYISYISINNTIFKGEIYNIGTDETYTLIDIANNIKSIMQEYNKEVDIIIENKEGEYKNNSLNITKIFNVLKWRPKYYLKDIIQEEIERIVQK